MRFVRFIFTGSYDCDKVLHWIANNHCPIRLRKRKWEVSRGRYMRQGKVCGLELVLQLGAHSARIMYFLMFFLVPYLCFADKKFLKKFVEAF